MAKETVYFPLLKLSTMKISILTLALLLGISTSYSQLYIITETEEVYSQIDSLDDWSLEYTDEQAYSLLEFSKDLSLLKITTPITSTIYKSKYYGTPNNAKRFEFMIIDGDGNWFALFIEVEKNILTILEPPKKGIYILKAYKIKKIWTEASDN